MDKETLLYFRNYRAMKKYIAQYLQVSTSEVEYLLFIYSFGGKYKPSSDYKYYLLKDFKKVNDLFVKMYSLDLLEEVDKGKYQVIPRVKKIIDKTYKWVTYKEHISMPVTNRFFAEAFNISDERRNNFKRVWRFINNISDEIFKKDI